MPYRDPDGVLSNFNRTPGQLDEFRIKETFNGDTSNLDSLEQASDWNHYFDACLRIEAYLKNRIGGPLQTGESGETDKVGAPHLYMSYATLTTTNASGEVTTLTGTVPAEFGDNPFLDHRFGIIHSLYVDQGSTPIAGVYANKPSNSQGYLNDLIGFPQYYMAITPTATGATGRDFTVSIMKIDPFGSTWVDSFYRTGPSWVWETDSGGAEPLSTYGMGPAYVENILLNRATFGCVQRTQYINPIQNGRGGGGKRWSIIMTSERSNYPCGGTCIPVAFESGTDMHCDFQFHDVAGINVETNEYPLSCGIVLRFNGSATGASGYGLYWGGFVPDAGPNHEGWYRVQLVKLNGVNLHSGRGGFVNPYTAGDILNLSGTGYHALTFGGSGGVPQFYRLQVEGTTISLKHRSGSGNWTTVLTASDSSISSGQAGFFSQPLDDASCRYLFLTDVTFRNDSVAVPVGFTVPLIYTLAGKVDGTTLGHE